MSLRSSFKAAKNTISKALTPVPGSSEVEHHIREEENNVWKVVKDNFSDADRIRMNVAFVRAKARVRVTR